MNLNDEAIMRALQAKLRAKIGAGDPCGPFYAAVVDENGTIVAEAANSVVPENCSHNHAEMNAIRLAEQKLGSWNLARRGLSLYTTAEPCMMCVGGILWSGIERVVYGIGTESVERIAGFDEGFKPRWREEFADRGISVAGPVAPEVGEEVMKLYVSRQGVVYSPKRDKNKAEIRRGMRARRKALTPEERAHAASVVCAKIVADGLSPEGSDASAGRGVLAAYLASPDEIDLAAAIREMLERGVTVVAPRWNGETYELAKLRSLREEDLRKGPMGILEPKDAEIVAPGEVGVWLIPGLAFTRDGKRLGYGGGWYDRLLAQADRHAKKYGIAHSFQIVDDLPSEPHDIFVDAVIEGRA